MSNASKSPLKNKWTNSDLSSLSLWVNEGVPIDEIAKRLKKSPASIENVISTKRGILKPRSNMMFEKKSSNELVHHNISYFENIIIITSIVQVSENYFHAKVLMSDTKLSESSGIMTNEFKTTEACMRWFDVVAEEFAMKIN